MKEKGVGGETGVLARPPRTAAPSKGTSDSHRSRLTHSASTIHRMGSAKLRKKRNEKERVRWRDGRPRPSTSDRCPKSKNNFTRKPQTEPMILHSILGGAAVHRCDKWLALSAGFSRWGAYLRRRGFHAHL